MIEQAGEMGFTADAKPAAQTLDVCYAGDLAGYAPSALFVCAVLEFDGTTRWRSINRR